MTSPNEVAAKPPHLFDGNAEWAVDRDDQQATALGSVIRPSSSRRAYPR
jgi:hypothetical protein